MSSVSSGTTTGTGLVHTSDTTGDYVIKTGASATTAVTISGTDQSVTFAVPMFSTGDVKLTLKTTADTGWVLMNDTTIGNGSSGATGRANADTATLYALLWNNTADAQCAVSTGRGASAAADYAANKTIALPKALGRALATYGSGSGLTARAMALAYGVETHPLTSAENGTHSHPPSSGQWLKTNGGATGWLAGAGTVLCDGETMATSGSGTAHQNMQPTLFLNTMIKL